VQVAQAAWALTTLQSRSPTAALRAQPRDCDRAAQPPGRAECTGPTA